jgi:S-adenosylmethionine hydrolase
VSRPIVFLSDYGLDDEFVGICRGVIARIAPQAPVMDLTHGVPPGDVLRGALLLARSTGYMPGDAVFLAVVDPGVGTNRRAVAVRTGSGQALVGPDNGLLSLAWDGLGGAAEAVEIAAPDLMLRPVSSTFHGRDVFAPAAAHLATGMPLPRLGPPVEPSSLVRLAVPPALVGPGAITTVVLSVDRFGNVELAATAGDLEAAGLVSATALEVKAGAMVTSTRRVATFGDVEPGSIGLIVDSFGWLALVVNQGNAAELLEVRPGQPVTMLGTPGPRGR